MRKKHKPCLLWDGPTDVHGYGRGQVHRIAFQLINGRIPPGLLAMHLCDLYYEPGDVTYRRCFEPSHLAIGTHADNMAQMVITGRSASGPRSGAMIQPERVARGSRHRSVTDPASVRRGPFATYWTNVTVREAFRSKLGVEHPSAKLTPDKVREIRRLRAAEHTTISELSRRFGVGRPSIRNILESKTW